MNDRRRSSIAGKHTKRTERHHDLVQEVRGAQESMQEGWEVPAHVISLTGVLNLDPLAFLALLACLLSAVIMVNISESLFA